MYRHLYLDVRPPSLRGVAGPLGPVLELRPVAGDDAVVEPASWPIRAADRPLVGLSLGSAFNAASDAQAVVMQGLADLDADVVVAAAPATHDPALGLPGNVAVVDGLTFSELASRADVVIAHGGASTTLAALAVGVPVVFLPFGGDQFLDADAVADAGAGVVVEPDALNPDALRAAVSRCLEPEPRRVARAIAAEIAGMPAPAEVAERLHQPRSEWVSPVVTGPRARLTVTVGGHATVIVESAVARVIIDPVFGDALASGVIRFAPSRRWNLDAVGPVTGIVLTHRHLDHFDPESMQLLPKDVEVVLPPDRGLHEGVRALGFERMETVGAWQRRTHGDLELIATPSDAEVDEYGMIIRSGNASYWHIADSYIPREVGSRVRQLVGPVGCVAAAYQPFTLLPSVQRGLGTTHDERESVVEWLEAACSADPAFVFPGFWGLGYSGVSQWIDRYASPFSPGRIARLLIRRLGEGRAAEVRPGDVVEIDGSAVRHRPGVSPFVVGGDDPSSADAYEPVDISTLVGVGSAHRPDLRRLLEEFFRTELRDFLQRMDLTPWAAYGVVWQIVVHAGGGERLQYHVDFRERSLVMKSGRHEDANYVVHLGGRALLDVLRHDAGSEVFWLGAASRCTRRSSLSDPRAFACLRGSDGTSSSTFRNR